MKKLLLSWMILALGVCLVSAQNSRNRKATTKKSVAKTTQKLEREKFDPKRNPNTDLQNAIIKAGKENRRIILDVGGEWCGWCIKMDKYFLANPALTRVRDRDFIWIKVNFSPENENKEFLSKYPEITGYPHLFLLETDGSFLHSQGTAELEEPSNIVLTNWEKANGITLEKKRLERGYDLYKFVEFFKLWSSN